MITKKYFILLLAGFSILSSCKKELEQNPYDTFNEANAFLTMDDINQGVNGAYGRYGAYANDMYVSALVSDEAKLGINNSGQGALTYRYQYAADATTGGDVTSAFYDYYSLIDQVNRVLPKVPTVTAANPAEEASRDSYKAQLLALRAIAHFELMRNYSGNYDPSALGVPIMTQSSVFATPARNTMGEVMTQIETDLSDAKTLLPAVTPSTFSDTALNKISVAGFQARIALYKGDYAAAITYATEVINSNVKPLVDASTFPLIWTDQSTAELLFRIRYATSTAIGGLWTTTSNSIYISPSDKLLDAYDADNDIRFDSYFAGLGGNPVVYKFFISPRGGRVVDMKALRTAEIYLIRAEADAKSASPNLTLGADDLNALRAMRINGYTPESFATAQDLINAVIEERYKELCFEGFRFYDLKRNNLPVNRASTDAAPEWQTLPAGNYRFVFPIPASEMLVNPNMIQNPGGY